MCDIVFEKAKGCGWTVNRRSVYTEAAPPLPPPKGFFMRNLAEFTRKHLCWNLFFDKVKPCRSATSLKTSL